MITKKKKQEIVADLTERFQKAAAIYLIDFTGLTVEGAIRLRRALKEEEIEMKVAKNSLIKRAMEGSDFDGQFQAEDFIGATAVLFTYDDAVMPARVVAKQVKDFKLPKFKAAVLDGQYFGNDQLKQLAALPNKQDNMAAIIGSINAPASGIVGAINAVIRDVAYLVEEVAKKQAS